MSKGVVSKFLVKPKPSIAYGLVHPLNLSGYRDDLAGLLDILSYRRPHDSDTERQWVSDTIDPLGWLPQVTSFEIDDFGNRWFTVGSGADNVLLSCHVDTVSSAGGRQAIGWLNDDDLGIGLVSPKAGRSLGADDGAGCWLLMELIKAGKAGRYVFHRGEEVGCLGSRYVATHDAKRLEGVTVALALDRKGTDNLITHQSGMRGLSDSFAHSLADMLRDASAGRLVYVLDDTGSCTDTLEYFDHVSECGNISIGYYGEHGPRETLDGLHVLTLRNALLRCDLSALVPERDHTIMEDSWGGYGGGWRSAYGRGSGREYRDDLGYEYMDGGASGFGNVTHRDGYESIGFTGGWNRERDGEPCEMLSRICALYPDIAARLLSEYGVSGWDLLEELPLEDADRLACGAL